MSGASTVRIPWFWSEFGDAEVDGIVNAVRARRINQGALCADLERQLAAVLEVPHVVMCNNGSSALVMALLACGVKPGDEVVVPASTFVATGNAAVLLGATARLVDVCADRPLIDVTAIEGAMTPRTKVILPVHLNGASADMAAITALAGRHGLQVVEDTAQAFGSRGPQGALGTHSRAGTFSMAVSKLICTGEGGFVATRDAAIDTHLRELRNHGTLTIRNNRFERLGLNFRMTDFTAAIALAQLAKLPAKVAAVRRLDRLYREGLAGLPCVRMLPVDLAMGEVPTWVQVVCAERNRVEAMLAERGIQTRCMQPSLSDSPQFLARGAYPRARFFADNGLVLPCGPDQPDRHIEETIDALHDIGRDIRGEAPVCP
ncbi:MAG: DegT/DnrJ/EryC1/StrS family aminotransferase [Lentisphaerae bacterium]|nr:DegT/DnrJ/EryC1/StrS family aminotransferase [Lentisphaerota bacterium]